MPREVNTKRQRRNAQRRDSGRRLLALMAKECGNDDARADITDALTNILHATDGVLDIARCARSARMHYEIEIKALTEKEEASII